MEAKIILEDKTEFTGQSFGAPKPTSGEVVFSTAMTGYVEALTDPSYTGQILIFTYPLIGNYGVPPSAFYQSSKIQVAGLLVSRHCPSPCHHQSQKTLEQWLKESGVPAISGIDTRYLTQKIRRRGTMLGKIIPQGFSKKRIKFYDPNQENLAAKVSALKIKIRRPKRGQKTIGLIDCGVKKAIINALIKRRFNVVTFPYNCDLTASRFFSQISGVVVSNGPGNPEKVRETIAVVKKLLRKKIPVLGICLGNQILALAAGAATYKLKFGHRSLNQPVKDLQTNRCYITSQNHGFAIDKKTLPSGWKERFVNLNDQTCEGIISQNGFFLGVQFHPEGHPGPEDTSFIFDEFAKIVNST